MIPAMFSCNHVKTCPPCFTPPEPLGIRLISKVDSTDLITSGFFHKDSIRMFYYERDVKKDIPLIVHTDSITKKSMIISNDVAWTSASGYKDFYLTLNSKVTDTLYLNVVNKEDDCCAYFEYVSFKYNKQVVQTDHIDGVYDIKK